VDDNGSGNAGGNGSIYWKVTHGNHQKKNPQSITALDHEGAVIRKSGNGRMKVASSAVGLARPVPPRGHVMVDDDTVQGHTSCDYRRIGRSANDKDDGQHPGMFLVRLRFRKVDLPKLSPEESAWVMANRDPKLSDENDFYVVIRVPAIDRKDPRPDGTWDDEKWEIHWEW
jgi:hypothetical protein